MERLLGAHLLIDWLLFWNLKLKHDIRNYNLLLFFNGPLFKCNLNLTECGYNAEPCVRLTGIQTKKSHYGSDLPWSCEQTPPRWPAHPLAACTEWSHSSPAALPLSCTPPSRSPCPSTAPGPLQFEGERNNDASNAKNKKKTEGKLVEPHQGPVAAELPGVSHYLTWRVQHWPFGEFQLTQSLVDAVEVFVDIERRPVEGDQARLDGVVHLHIRQ